jgi:hypothetical protein
MIKGSDENEFRSRQMMAQPRVTKASRMSSRISQRMRRRWN